MTSNRPERVGEAIRDELSKLIGRELRDPGVGFITLTTVKVAPDLQLARVYYTSMGDAKARRDTARALDRALPFLRRQVAQRLRLRRAPELQFFYDESIAHQDRIEQILQDLKSEAESRGEGAPANAAGEGEPRDAPGPTAPGDQADGAHPRDKE